MIGEKGVVGCLIHHHPNHSRRSKQFRAYTHSSFPFMSAMLVVPCRLGMRLGDMFRVRLGMSRRSCIPGACRRVRNRGVPGLRLGSLLLRLRRSCRRDVLPLKTGCLVPSLGRTECRIAGCALLLPVEGQLVAAGMMLPPSGTGMWNCPVVAADVVPHAGCELVAAVPTVTVRAVVSVLATAVTVRTVAVPCEAVVPEIVLPVVVAIPVRLAVCLVDALVQVAVPVVDRAEVAATVVVGTANGLGEAAAVRRIEGATDVAAIGVVPVGNAALGIGAPAGDAGVDDLPKVLDRDT